MALRRDDQDVRHTGGEGEGYGWQLQAACRAHETAAFYPPPHFERKELRLARERVAKSICRRCPVVDECLDYALRTREPHGVWGGLNEFERRDLGESDRSR